MTLYQFVESAIEAMGGILVPLEYALCSMLIPEDFQDAFQGKSEMLLAFDYEVAQENPDSEFVTYGSFVFDTIFQIARSSARVTQRYAYVGRLELSNADQKIKKHMNLQSASCHIVYQRPVVGLWALYNFVILYTFDERFEETKEVWVNLTNGCLDNQIVTNTIFYDTKETFSDLPHVPPISMQTAYQLSYEQAEHIALNKTHILSNDSKIEKELDRIKNYYDEMITENKKRATRKDVTEERLSEIMQKEKALILEKNKQMHEIKEKYTIKTNVSLDNAIIYHIPLIEILCKINYHRNVYEQLFYYDPIGKRIIEG